jgi:diguanylate cyclase (GGDEF)-like protein
MMAAEAAVIAALVLALFRLRSRLGLAPLYVTIGAFQYFQLVLTPALVVEYSTGLLISPAAVLFIASLFAILVVYLWEDAVGARKLIYGIVLANVCLAILSILFGLHLDLPGTRNIFNLPYAMLLQNVRIMMVGAAVIFLDVILIILVYEALGRLLRRFLFIRLFASMAIVLVVDTVLFVSGSFGGQAVLAPFLVSGLMIKPGMSAVYALALVLYLRFVEHPGGTTESHGGAVRDVFHTLTYREKYEHAQLLANKDSLTELFNRRYFDSLLPNELERAKRYKRPTTLLVVDIDRFKQINDEYGHQEGDRVLQLLGETLKDSIRSADVACRIGGEEFAVILPYASLQKGIEVGQRIRALLASRCHAAELSLSADRVTVTIGVASSPSETVIADDLLRLADRRLYLGKQRGRDQVVGANEEGINPESA